jgi:glycosyltransferase involved in cell wall biosynthesis
MEVMPYFLPDPDLVASSRSSEPPHPRPYFLFVGRLERIKGLDDVIPAFERYPDADLLIAGDGDHAAALKHLAKDNPRIVFLGRVDAANLEHYYGHALALIVPSVCFETFGIVLIESFKQATPVIARRLGPFPEIVRQSRGGELFETETELLSAMARVQKDVARRQAMGEAGQRAYRERWSESVVVPRYLDIVRRAAERRGAAHSPVGTISA